jgi:septum formation inhibitor-activating ATPase MinD
LEKFITSFPFQKNRQRYNVTRKNMQNLVSALTNLNFQYIFTAQLGEAAHENAQRHR